MPTKPLADVVVEHLVGRGLRNVFLVSGGGIMHLLDAVGRAPGLRYVCTYHEQAAAIAAESYARIAGRPALCLVTTGPGAVNALSGVIGSWFDSIPMIVVSGQVRTPLLADYATTRQVGPQEANVLPMVRPAVKRAVSLRDPRAVRREMDLAWETARGGRPGPVWVEIPLDVQSAALREEEVFPVEAAAPAAPPADLPALVARSLELLASARRPVLILGNGIHLARAERELDSLLERISVPILLPLGGLDLVPETHPDHLGAFGPIGRRAANFALQTSDLVVSIGASLAIAMIGFGGEKFAPRARKVVVNVDSSEIAKASFPVALPICADAGDYVKELRRQLEGRRISAPEGWVEACREWKRRYPPVEPAWRSTRGAVHSYVLAEELANALGEGDVVVTGNSLDAWSVYQAFRVKPGQRVLFSNNCGAMGWDLPAAVGAAVARPPGRVVLVTGDGSLQFNVQELLTLSANGLAVKIFVLENGGYEAIRATQTTFFEGRLVGADPASGVRNPDFRHLAAAFGLGYDSIRENDELPDAIRRVLAAEGPVLCEVRVSPEQGRSPRAGSFRREDGTLASRPLEDMAPPLPREELRSVLTRFDGDDA